MVNTFVPVLPIVPETAEQKAARLAAYRLGGRGACAALFCHGEVGECPSCEGRGAETRIDVTDNGFQDEFWVTCSLCEGTGCVRAMLAVLGAGSLTIGSVWK